MSVVVKSLKAEHGDAFIITVGDGDELHYIVVDGGPSSRFCIDDIVNELKSIPVIDLMVLTNFDDDQIAVLIEYIMTYKNDLLPVKRIWANCSKNIQMHLSTDISYEQAATLDNYLSGFSTKQEIVREDAVNNTLPKYDFGFCQIQVLSPTPKALEINVNDYIEETASIASTRVETDRNMSLEDLSLRKQRPRKDGDDVINRSSIAFLLEAEGKTLLMMGDADPWMVADKLNSLGYSQEYPLSIDLMKVSHHGSRNNTCNNLLKVLACNNFLFSTNGGFGNSYHPDRETIARILCNSKKAHPDKPLKLFFNYPLSTIEERTGLLLTEEEKRQHPCCICDGSIVNPLVVTLK